MISNWYKIDSIQILVYYRIAYIPYGHEITSAHICLLTQPATA